MSETARFALPLLHSGQAQKELSHNEALTLIDALLSPCALGMGSNMPPADPEPGQCWIVGEAPGGAWADAPGALAVWTQGGWRLIAPRDGMVVKLAETGCFATRSAIAWDVGVIHATEIQIAGVQVIGVRQPTIAVPAAGDTVDAEARAAITHILDAMCEHGLIESA